jgi:hypothetical protein
VCKISHIFPFFFNLLTAVLGRNFIPALMATGKVNQHSAGKK